LLTYWPCNKQGPLFPFQITSRQILNCWKETIQTAHVKFVSIHALRATYAAMMHDVFGLTPKEIAKILGT